MCWHNKQRGLDATFPPGSGHRDRRWGAALPRGQHRRELGIPAVVGTGEATMRLRTGDRVRVNGTQGTVEPLED